MLADRLAKVGVSTFAVGDREVGAERTGRVLEGLRGMAAARQLRRHLEDERPDVVHAHGFPPSLVAALVAPARAGRVYTHHYERRPPGLLERTALTAVFGRFDVLTTPAAHLTVAMNRYFPRLRHAFRTMKFGVGGAFYGASPSDRWHRSFSPGMAVAVTVGRLVPTKNVSLVVEAIGRLPATDRSRVAVLVVGDGPERSALEERVRSQGLTQHIKFLGHVPREEMPSLLSSVDFGIFPSVSEAASVAAAEALAAGLPLLALDVPAMRETVGPAGMLVTAPEFPDALVRMLDSFQELRPVAVRRGLEWTIEKARDAWIELYLEAQRT